MDYNFPKWIRKDEAAIIDGLITAILNRGHTISVYDGEEYATGRSADRAEIQKETAGTDETTYVLRDATSKRQGHFWLIHGNGCDVISDYSDTTICDEIWNEIEPLMDDRLYA